MNEGQFGMVVGSEFIITTASNLKERPVRLGVQRSEEFRTWQCSVVWCCVVVNERGTSQLAR